MSLRALTPLATLAVLIVAATSVAAETWPGKMGWARKPSAEDMRRFYPEKAATTATPGRTIIDCDVTDRGLLDRCRVVEQFPAGYGFGDAGLKLSKIFRIDPKTVDATDPTRSRVVIPIIFGYPGKQSPPTGHLAGQNAVALSVGVKPSTPNARPCPTIEKPAQLCVVRALEWAQQPWLADTVPMLEGVDMTSGVTALQCQVSEFSRLTGCLIEGDPTPAARKAMLTVASHLVAPEKTTDGTKVGEGPVIVPFDWAKITPLARTLKRP